MNHLQNHPSLYLRQHANNPVDWHPWAEEALIKAKEHDKLIVVSIGYSSCHWCHVMEHECFEHEDVGNVMNEDFISIKVDREERPDVDQVYMDAVHLMGGQGGWPLNIVALPDGRPIWGGTYVPKEKWKKILGQLADLFKNDRDSMVQYASKLANGVSQMNLISAEVKSDFGEGNWHKVFETVKAGFDRELGGMNRSPKFPMPEIYQYLLHHYAETTDVQAIDQVVLTLTKMAKGGIYDQVGGGFARYSVDSYWKVPHFEKMLYDNAQLIGVYAQAYKATGNPLFKKVVYETVEWLKREMKTPSGLYASALDADSENGVEGAFYAWTLAEIQDALGNDAENAIAYWQLRGSGAWENDLCILLPDDGRDIEEIQVWREKMLAYREKHKSKPVRDDKSLTAWNALLAKGFITAYEAFQDSTFLEEAKSILGLLTNDFNSEVSLKRVLDAPDNPAFLDDYAHVIEALLSLFQNTGDSAVLKLSGSLIEKVLSEFSLDNGPLLLLSKRLADSPFASKLDFQDNVIPSPNSVMAYNLFQYGQITSQQEFVQRAKEMAQVVLPQSSKDPSFFMKWIQLQGLFTNHFYEVVITGDYQQELPELHGNLWYGKVILPATDGLALPLTQQRTGDSEVKIFVCTQGTCQLPVGHVKDVIAEGRLPTPN